LDYCGCGVLAIGRCVDCHAFYCSRHRSVAFVPDAHGHRHEVYAGCGYCAQDRGEALARESSQRSSLDCSIEMRQLPRPLPDGFFRELADTIRARFAPGDFEFYFSTLVTAEKKRVAGWLVQLGDGERFSTYVLDADGRYRMAPPDRPSSYAPSLRKWLRSEATPDVGYRTDLRISPTTPR
jgi:hypothetical protein